MPSLGFGPVTVNTYGTDPSVQLAVVFDTGLTGADLLAVHTETTSHVDGYSGSSDAMDLYWYSSSNVLLHSDSSGYIGWDQSSPFVFDAMAPAGAQRVVIAFATALDPPGTAFGSRSATATINGSISGVTGAICEYGTQLQTGGTFLYYLTPAAIDGALITIGHPELAALFSAFWFTYINAQEICGSGPPTMPTFTVQDFVNIALAAPGPSQLKAHQALEAIMWPVICQCTPAPPGDPPPTPPPPPTVTVPPGLTTPPPVTCDGTDVCAMLNQIEQALGALNRQLTVTNNNLTLVQRQAVPFAYVPGTLHSGLTDAGEFAVQGILAVAVQLTTLPGRLGEEAGDPVAYFDAGWVTLGTPDGWRRSSPIRHNPQWLDAQPDDTLVGYSFTPGIVANIQEFKREP